MTVTQMPPTPAEPEAEVPKKSKKKLLIVVVVLLLLGGGAYWKFLGPAAASEPEGPVPGEVVALDPIQVNLAADHYLSIGIALQLTEEAYEVDGSKALDATIELFSGRPLAEVTDEEKRYGLKKKLSKEVEELYEGKVMKVYFTEFVTQ